jgi:protein-tyrosine phosphatase
LDENDFKKEKELLQQFEELKKRTREAGINVQLHLGCEVYAYPDMNLDKSFATLNNNGKYFLVEFPMNTVPVFIPETFFNFVLNGKIPIIAHPERNLSIIKDPHQAYDFVQRGALLQINAGSLHGIFGQSAKRTSELMMDANLVHFIASDAHSSNTRHPKLKATYELVTQRWGQERATQIFVENPQKVLAGKKIVIPNPIAFENLKENKKGLLNLFAKYIRKATG